MVVVRDIYVNDFDGEFVVTVVSDTDFEYCLREGDGVDVSLINGHNIKSGTIVVISGDGAGMVVDDGGSNVYVMFPNSTGCNVVDIRAPRVPF